MGHASILKKKSQAHYQVLTDFLLLTDFSILFLCFRVKLCFSRAVSARAIKPGFYKDLESLNS